LSIVCSKNNGESKGENTKTASSSEMLDNKRKSEVEKAGKANDEDEDFIEDMKLYDYCNFSLLDFGAFETIAPGREGKER
jgi:hypothetical protein